MMKTKITFAFLFSLAFFIVACSKKNNPAPASRSNLTNNSFVGVWECVNDKTLDLTTNEVFEIDEYEKDELVLHFIDNSTLTRYEYQIKSSYTWNYTVTDDTLYNNFYNVPGLDDANKYSFDNDTLYLEYTYVEDNELFITKYVKVTDKSYIQTENTDLNEDTDTDELSDDNNQTNDLLNELGLEADLSTIENLNVEDYNDLILDYCDAANSASNEIVKNVICTQLTTVLNSQENENSVECSVCK